VQQDHRTVAARPRARHGVLDDLRSRTPRLPILEDDVIPDVAIAELGEESQHPRVVRAGTERTSEPGPRVDPARGRDVLRALAHVLAEALVVQQGHAGVVFRVVAHEMAVVGDPPRALRIRFRPTTLDEEGRTDPGRSQRIQDAVGSVRRTSRPIGVLCVEGERHAEDVVIHGS
jgi:hypothetical protein